MNENETVDTQETINPGAEVDVETQVETEIPEVKTKPVETKEARVARLKRQLKKAQNELGTEEAEEEVVTKRKPKDLNYGEKAFLISNGIKGKDEYDLVRDMMADTGKSLEDVVESKYFQAQLKEQRSLQNSQMASEAASGSKRGTPSARDTVEYWVAKGELPPSHMTQLRRDVVKAKVKARTDNNHFTDTPVIS